MLCERMATDMAALSCTPNLRGIVVTLAAEGCDVWQQGRVAHLSGVAASAVVDPTACGDAFRAGLLFGLERGWPLERCAELGNRLGALKISCREVGKITASNGWHWVCNEPRGCAGARPSLKSVLNID